MAARANQDRSQRLRETIVRSSLAVSKPQSATCTASWPAARTTPPRAVRDWHRQAASTRGRERQLSFLGSCRRPFKSSKHVLAVKARVVLEDLLDCPAGRQLAEYSSDRDPRIADTEKAPHPTGIDGDPLIWHAQSV
jgi:hypothetical protein